MHAHGAGGALAIEALGETTLLLRFGHGIDAALNARVHQAAATLRLARLPGVTDIVPAYASLAIVYSPAEHRGGDDPPWRHLAAAVGATLALPAVDAVAAPATLEIPVCYGDDAGPDLDELARRLGLPASTIIARHAAADYRVAMLGFAPGFPYLLGLDPSLHTPRRASPRTRVPRGTVAIGGAQTGIYPSELPGGWQLIGRTPLVLFDPRREPACLLAAGDHVRFRAIDAEEFDHIERANTQ